MTLIGVTTVSVEETLDYREAKDLSFPILADAETTQAAWGVDLIWGNVVRLVNPEGQVVAEGLQDSTRTLSQR